MNIAPWAISNRPERGISPAHYMGRCGVPPQMGSAETGMTRRQGKAFPFRAHSGKFGSWQSHSQRFPWSTRIMSVLTRC